jgi:hypothetical protein
VLIAVAVAAAALLASWQSEVRVLGDTAYSRLATAWSLVHHGTWVIGQDPALPPNPFTPYTVDKVAIDGHIYSTKPPILPMLMTAEYWVAHHAFGADLANPSHLKSVVRVMVLTLVTLPYVVTLLAFAAMLRWWVPCPWRRLYLVVALAFGTQLFGFATHIDNHVPAAGLLMASLYLGLGMLGGHLNPAGWRFFLCGLTGSLVFTIDMPMTIYFAILGLALLWRFPMQTLTWAAAGVLVPLLIHFGAMIAVTGSPLPIQMRKALYMHEAAYWRNPAGLDALNEPKGLYFFHAHFGRFGSFTLFPVLWLGIVGVFTALASRTAAARGLVLTGALAFAVLTVYYVFDTNNYGGSAYGFRWHIAAMPVLLLMAAPAVNRLRSPWLWGVLLVLLAVSCYSAWECHMTPWGEHQEWTCKVFGTAF